jgi:hypothetical protein
MSDAPRFDDGLYDSPGQAAPPPPRSGSRSCLMGCLAVVVFLAVLLLMLGIWIARNWREWAASGASQLVQQAIDASDFPQQEKVEIMAQVDRVTDAVRDGRMSIAQLQTLFERLAQSPLMASLMVAAVDEKYLNKSGLSDEEKTEGRLAVRRFVRGVIDERIPEAAADTVLAPISTRKADGQLELKDRVTDAELQAFFAAAKAEADKAGIPEEPEEIDPSAEFERIVDEALGKP